MDIGQSGHISGCHQGVSLYHHTANTTGDCVTMIIVIITFWLITEIDEQIVNLYMHRGILSCAELTYLPCSQLLAGIPLFVALD